MTSLDGQLTLWAAAEEAVRRVEQHADPDWLKEAEAAVLGVALRRRRFTTDDVWNALAGTEASTHEPRAMGAVMRHCAREGWCAPTHDYLTSKRRACHSRPLRVWKSLLFE